ncbi:hypothetical protein AB4564_04270 [Vibrio sp. 10N.222.51.E8]|uniref:hypothetical protein n=1 Tax=Vibrio sp. 10N.222.51.E8 TaxID=3229625 RepID=UPI00354C179A
MSKDLKKLLNNVIESMRYQFGTHSFLDMFIDYWCFLHTEMYPPSETVIEQLSVPDIQKDCQLMTHLICKLAIEEGETDVLGDLLSKYSSLAHTNDFFPTPIALAKLLAGLNRAGMNEDSGAISLYEPCVGSGAVTLSFIENEYFDHLDKSSPLDHLTVCVEEISELLCKAFLIQLLLKLQHLEYVGGKPALPASVVIQQTDVISRKQRKVCFNMESPEG